MDGSDDKAPFHCASRNVPWPGGVKALCRRRQRPSFPGSPGRKPARPGRSRVGQGVGAQARIPYRHLVAGALLADLVSLRVKPGALTGSPN